MYRSRPSESGFSLAEVMIGMMLTALVMTASLPSFIALLKSSVTVKLDTRAKNLTQERIEQMRALPFHLDRQNGPFLDLLDIYYTNAKLGATTGSLSIGGTVLSGQYVSSGLSRPGEPAAPFYRVTTEPLSGASGFTQTISTQFLRPNGAVISAAAFQNSYDTQLVGQDQPPSLLVGLTVITSWNDYGKPKSFRAHTRIVDGRSAAPIIQTQAHAVSVDVTSTAADGTTLKLQLGVASAGGSQASGSTASGYATGAIATRTGSDPITGLLSQFDLPVQGIRTSGAAAPASGIGCGWYGFGRSGLSRVDGDISTGLPRVPTDVDLRFPDNALTGYLVENGGGECGVMTYDNLYGGGLTRPPGDPIGDQMGAAPYVRIEHSAGGSAAVVSGAAYVVSNPLTSVAQTSSSGAAAFALQRVVLFPGNPYSGGQGLVSVTLHSSRVDCQSGLPGADGKVVGKYQLTMGWWGKGSIDLAARWHTAAWSYDSATSLVPLLVSGSDTWDPATTSLGNGLFLDQLVTSSLTGAAPAVVTVGAASGLRGFTNGILSLNSASTLTNESGAGYSAVKLQIGQLTCVADDQR